jgi:hypothetical protein
MVLLEGVMTAEVMFRIVGFCICAFIGVLLARRLSAPKNRWVWVAWLVLLVAAPYIGVSTRLVSFPAFTLYFNDAMQGFVFGLLAEWLYKSFTIKT